MMKQRPASFLSALLAAFCMLLAAPMDTAAAGQLGDAMLLVAKPQHGHPLYRAMVVLAKPLIDGGHIGFVVNKPTSATLAKIYPNHPASRKAADSLFLGGPTDVGGVFALVQRHGRNDGAMQISPDLFLATNAADVDSVFESDTDNARFFAGLVV
jgi:putative AlgH/UPF0301 family transcriptional regulator